MDFDFVEVEEEVTDLSTRFEVIEVIDLARRNGKGDHSSKIHPGLDKKPGVSNWVDQEGGLPDFIDRIAKHIHADSGLSISRAIAAAVNRVKVLAAKGNAKAIAALAQWNAKKASANARPNKGKGKNLSATDDAVEVVDLGLLRRAKQGTYSTVGGNASSTTSGVRGSAFNESKHQRTQNGQFGKKLNPSDIIAGRRKVEGNITNLQVGQTYELPDKLGWVKRTPGGYFVQGPAGFSASVRTLSEAVQAASMIIAGKARGAV